MKKSLFLLIPLAAAAQSPMPDSLRSAFQEIVRRVQPDGRGYRMENPENRIDARFDGMGLSLSNANGSGGLRLMNAPTVTSIQASGARLEYRRGALTEWYVNDARGIEQGFTLSVPMLLELAVTGDFTPVLHGDAIELQRENRAVLRYSGLRAWDAHGRDLPARMEVQDSRILLRVEDAGAVYPVTVDPWVQQQRLTPSDGVANDNFGQAVAVDGNTAVIGVPNKTGGGIATLQGVAYVFVSNGTNWTQQQKLTASDGVANDYFGSAVAVSGNTVVIGAYGKNPTGAAFPTGAAYVFVRNGATWSQQQKLTPTTAATLIDFGYSVGINGDTAVIGAPGSSVPHAAAAVAWVFVRNGNTWSQQQELYEDTSDPLRGGYLGWSVSVGTDRVALTTLSPMVKKERYTFSSAMQVPGHSNRSLPVATAPAPTTSPGPYP